MAIIAYCDGACSGNPGIGGWGVQISDNGAVQELCGGAAQTTNNRMELTAAIEVLRNTPADQLITIYTDSKYVMDGLTQWLPKWRQNGFRNAQRKPVKNQDLWLALEEQAQGRDIRWQWVRGHSGNAGNERADALANMGMDRFR